MRSILAFCLLFLLASGAVAQEERIAAIVNEDVISANDLANRLRLVMRSSGIEDTAQNRDRLSPQILRALIDEKLQLQEAKRLGVTVGKDEIDQAFTRLEQQNNMPKGALDKFLADAGIPRQTLIDQVTAALAWGKVVRNQLTQQVSVSEEEITAALARLKENADVPQSRVSEIFLAIDNPSQEDEAKRLADRLIEQITSGGANFAAVARQFSQSPSAAVGGDIGWVAPGALPPELADALQKMNPGQISYPIRTPSGYYILYLLERRKSGQPDPDETVLSLVQLALPLPPGAGPAEEENVAAELEKLAQGAKSCGELAKIGQERSPEGTRQLNQIKAAALPPALRRVALDLPLAEPSKPVSVPGGVGIVMVCERTDPPGGLPSREEVADQLGRARLDALARRYLRDLRRSAYIDIRQ